MLSSEPKNHAFKCFFDFASTIFVAYFFSCSFNIKNLIIDAEPH
jgi:hypothetical protein